MLDSSKFPNQSYRFSNSWAFKSFDEWVRVWASEFEYPEGLSLEDMAARLEADSLQFCADCGCESPSEIDGYGVRRCFECAADMAAHLESMPTWAALVKSSGLYRCERCRRAVTYSGGLVVGDDLQTYCAATAFSGHTIGL